MTGKVIPASNRFGHSKRGRETSATDPAQAQAEIERRKQERLASSARLREILSETTRIPKPDRQIVARNFGRMIERRYPEERKAWAAKLLEHAFGPGKAESALKKRTRYIRFDGEAISDQDQFFATRREVLRLSDSWAELQHGTGATGEQKAQMLETVCEGASFHEPARRRLIRGQDYRDVFRCRMSEMIDLIARRTDIVGYLDEVRHHDIQTFPVTGNDLSEEALFGLSENCFPVERFDHCAGDEKLGYKDYARLRLAGYEFNAEQPPDLLPRIRLARIYWPRQVLCLDAGVSADTMRKIYQDHKEAEAWAIEKQVRSEALRTAGYDPENMDWSALEEPETRRAVQGAKWRTFWQARSIDLHLTADQEPEALALVISVLEDHWPGAPRDLLKPQDDVVPHAKIENCDYVDDSSDLFAWFPDGDQLLVCRGFSGVVATTENNDYESIQFDPDYHPIHEGLIDMHFGPLDTEPLWSVLSEPMTDWKSGFYSHPSREYRTDLQPAFRPLFSAPPPRLDTGP